MSARTRSIAISLLLVFGLILASCAPQATEAPTEAPEPEPTMAEEEEPEEMEPTEPPMEGPETIKVGAVVPLTGVFAGGGAQVRSGYEIAVEDINAEGGVYVEEYDRQIPIELILLDDESDPNQTVSNLESLYSDEDVVVYLGGFGSSLHAAAAAIAEKNGVPYLGVAFALWDIHQQGYQYLFSPFWKSPAIATDVFIALNELLPEGERPTRVAIFQEQTDWGIELGNMWREQAPEYGYEVVSYDEYSVGTEDFTDIILRAQAAEAQTLLTLPIPPDGVTLFRQMGELGWAPDFSFAVRAPDPPTWPENLGAVGDYVTFGPGWHNAMEFPGVDALNEAHQERVGRPADPIVGPSYATVQILADAIERAGTLERDAIRDAIAETDMTTVIGPVSFREDGTADVASPILQYQDGVPQVVWPLEHATADFLYPAPPFDER